MEQRWNDIRRGKPKNSKKTFLRHKSRWTELGANSGVRAEKPAPNRLSYGTA
jgi:hypothetical protein